MSAELTLGIAAGYAVQEGVKFLYNQLSELLKRAREPKPTGANPPETLVATPPAHVFDPTPVQLRFPLSQVAGQEAQLASLLAEIDTYLRLAPERANQDSKVLEAIGALRALAESVTGEALAFAGEPQRDRPTLELDATIRLISSTGRFVGVSLPSDSKQSAKVKLEIDQIDGDGVAIQSQPNPSR